MHHLFTPNHLQLINAAYPPSSSLLTTDPSPNSQELSRLTYYASNHPGKNAKLGQELSKRGKAECRKAQSGNLKAKAYLLITLSIFRALVVECRADITLLSPSLISCVESSLSVPDLEVAARAASVFTVWTIYTNGQLIGTDSSITRDYLSILRKFASLSLTESKDHEVRNRTRLIGFAALTGALNSEALFNDTSQFSTQISIIMPTILNTLLQTDMSTLDDQASVVREDPISPYLAEFRTRPTMERRAASIHVHVDGDKGPSMLDVSGAALRALFSLLEHANGAQLGFIMQSSFDSLDKLNGWAQQEHCCWFGVKVADWSQYQYRYVIPTWLVERLTDTQDSSVATPVQHSLAAIITAVFKSPTPLVNLSTQEINSNLVSLLLKRISVNSSDDILPAVVQCVGSLGRHVYYSDQIQDLAGELLSRISVVQTQPAGQTRSVSLRSLLQGLVQLMQASDGHYAADTSISGDEIVSADHSRRTRVPPDMWKATLDLLCDPDYDVREEYNRALVSYVTEELHFQGDRIPEDPIEQPGHLKHLLQVGDAGFLGAIHAYLYSLAISPSQQSSTPPQEDEPEVLNSPPPIVNILPATPDDGPPPEIKPSEEELTSAPTGRPSLNLNSRPRSRKASLHRRLQARSPAPIISPPSIHPSDYSNIFRTLQVIHEKNPLGGLIIGIPMLLALDGAVTNDSKVLPQANAVKELIACVWLTIAKVWDCEELLDLVNKALETMPHPSMINPAPDAFSTSAGEWCGVSSETALIAVVSAPSIQAATELDRQGLLRRLSTKWTPESALKTSFESGQEGDQNEQISPLFKLTPALLLIENMNMSMQSLARPSRAVGVTDLREALEGRSSMSNTALVRPPSVSTLDHSSSLMNGDLSGRQSRSRSKKRPANGEPVKDVLTRLGIGKQQNSSLLKSSFPALQKQ